MVTMPRCLYNINIKDINFNLHQITLENYNSQIFKILTEVNSRYYWVRFPEMLASSISYDNVEDAIIDMLENPDFLKLYIYERKHAEILDYINIFFGADY